MTLVGSVFFKLLSFTRTLFTFNEAVQQAFSGDYIQLLGGASLLPLAHVLSISSGAKLLQVLNSFLR